MPDATAGDSEAPASGGQKAPAAVVLVHGFMASPAEMRRLAEWLCERGLLVIGARLAGHGTSPWDLHEQPWEAWAASLKQAEAIAAGLAEQFVTIGFSTGGALTLHASREPCVGRVGAIGVNVPAKFADPRMMLVPWVARANAILGSITTSEGILPFNPNTSEHPEVNYASIPTAALHQLMQLSELLTATPQDSILPTLILQSDGDPVVDPDGFPGLVAAFSGPLTQHAWLKGNRHGTIYDDDDGCWSRIQGFLSELGLLPVEQ